jgi:hypothetical protein
LPEKLAMVGVISTVIDSWAFAESITTSSSIGRGIFAGRRMQCAGVQG